MAGNIQYPPQQLPFLRKTKEWRKKHLDWAESRSFFNYSPVRNSVKHKKLNYDLVNGRLNLEDMKLIINPDNLVAGYIPDNIQHYPIMNSKLNLLRGEELSRVFDMRVCITNPNAVSEIENSKKEELLGQLQALVENTTEDRNAMNAKLEKLDEYYSYEWQDLREIRANALINHYSKELSFKNTFNDGFMDGMTVGEEIYQCDIIGGEPTLERLNPLKIRVFKSGASNRIEDAEMVVLEDYWSPSRVIDTYYDVLTSKDIKHIEEAPFDGSGDSTDSMGNYDDTKGFVYRGNVDESVWSSEGFYWEPNGGVENSLLPFDTMGNVRVLRVFWKSRRKIKKVKSYNLETGEEEFNLYPENYVVNKDLGEEEQVLWINEAWEGVKIGKDIYVNMRPRVVQYNRLDNPSRCHFGIVGQVYNLNEGKPFSMVDMMKPYNYMYNAVHDRLNKLIAHNWGKLVMLDLAKVPAGWEINKWLYYAKVNNLMVVDSFKEGNKGAATGVMAGSMNNAHSGVVDASMGNEIQFNISLLEFLKGEMSEIVGVTRQREGQISNRETVGGVERSTLQSSHITEWLFATHDDVKKRALECFLETAKIALKGHAKKFTYLLPDHTQRIIDIDGDEFAECDYGIVVDNSEQSQALNQNLGQLAQAALQNQLLDFTSLMKLYGSSSLAEKQRIVEVSEKKAMQRVEQQQQQQTELQQQQMQQQARMQQQQLEQQDMMNQRDNETRIIVAQINSKAEADRLAIINHDDGVEEPVFTEEAKANLKEKIREFDAKLKLDRQKLELEKKKVAKMGNKNK